MVTTKRSGLLSMFKSEFVACTSCSYNLNTLRELQNTQRARHGSKSVIQSLHVENNYIIMFKLTFPTTADMLQS